MNNKEMIAQSLSMLQIAWSTDMTRERFKLYCTMLADVNPVTLTQAVANVINRCKFLPSIAELREECSALSAYVNAHEELPTPQSAWERVIKCASTYGYEHGLEHLEGLTLKCAKSIWSSFNPLMGDEYNEASCRSQFIKQYEQEEKREMHRQRMANSIKDNHVLLKAREKAEKEKAMIANDKKQIEMTRTGNLVEVAKETKPVNLKDILDSADISENGKALLRKVIGG